VNTVTFESQWIVDGVLTDADVAIVLSDSGATYGAKRTDTGAIIAAAGTAMTRASTGVYRYTFLPPVQGLTYDWWAKVVYLGVTYYFQRTFYDLTDATRYSMNLAALRKAIKAANGGAIDVQLYDIDDLINAGIMRFVTARPWRWRERSMLLNTVAAQNYIDLPADLAQLVELKTVGTLTGTINLVTLEEIARMRATTPISNTLIYWAALSWTTQSSASGQPIPRLELFPTPDASTTGAFTGHYLYLPAILVNNNDVPNVPPSMLPALKACVVYHALEQMGADPKKKVEPAREAYERLLGQAAGEAGGLQRDLGKIIGLGSGRGRIVRVPVQVSYP
jgi:hypothetical protein